MNDKTDIVPTCANCGKGEEESGKLKNCTACMMVKYCSRECQIAHRPQHKKACKKRAAELYDEKLFKEPPSQYEDCPICLLRMPSIRSGRKYMECCGKMICCGCNYAPVYDHLGNEVYDQKCPFCRTPQAYSDEELNERENKRMQADDPIAIFNIGVYYRDREYGFPQDYTKALELWHRAGELGYATAYSNIANSYGSGRSVKIDKKKAKYYFELAAMGGSLEGRYNAGIKEKDAGNYDRALKHHMIAVRSGFAKSLEIIKKLYSDGNATKDDCTKALRCYQTYLGEIKSKQRDEAAAAHDEYRYY